jgi:hypothetical protein
MKKSLLLFGFLLGSVLQSAWAQCTTTEQTVVSCGSYTWHGTTYTSSGDYSYDVNNPAGCVDSEILHLTLSNEIKITTIASPKLCAVLNTTASISVQATSTTATYMWQYRVVTLANPNPSWISITAANASTVYTNYTTATLGIKKATTSLPAKGTEYRVLVSTGTCGTLVSNTAKLALIDIVKTGQIVSPSSVCTGGSITFSLSNFTASTYLWESSNSSTGVFTPIPDALQSTLTVNNVTASSNKSYRVIVTNAGCGGALTSAVKTITVDSPSIAGTVSGGGTFCWGSPATLKVTGSLGKIQWEYSKDGTTFFKAPIATDTAVIPYTTTSTSITTSTYLASNFIDPTYYRVRVTNGGCFDAISNVVKCQTGTEATVGTIIPTSATICKYSSTLLNVNQANGTITWEKSINWTSATPTWTPTTIHTSTYSTGSITVPTAFRVRVSIGNCSDQSSITSAIQVINLYYQPVTKPITANVTSPSGGSLATALCTDDTSKVLSVTPGYVGSIQWQVSTVSGSTGYIDIPGATSSTYTVTNASPGANYFRAKFYNECGVAAFVSPKIIFYTTCTGKTIDNSLPETKEFAVVAFPNPYTEAFQLHATTSSSEVVQLEVYDIMGRLIETNSLDTQALNDYHFGNTYPAGIYMLHITQGTTLKMLRVIKQ